MTGFIVAVTSVPLFALIWWVAFLRHAPRPSDTAAVAADRLRRLR